jgi:autotransporter-associated beta strand protein
MTLSGTNTFTGGTTIAAGSIRQGIANALPIGRALTVNGTSVFDLNGLDASVSTLGGVTTGIVTDNAAGSGTSTLSITSAGSSAVNITNGASRTLALRVTNANGGFLLTNGANTFSGGIILTNTPGGTRMAPGAIVAGAYGTGSITIGESPTDQAGIYFATGAQTLTNPIIFNTALGTDRVGIRTDAAGITLSGVITANLAPATFTANTVTAGSFFLTNKVTGASGLVLDITSLSASATQFMVTLNNAAGTNDYQGDTVVNFNAASGKSATLQLLAADQIPNGAGTGNVIVNSNATGIGLLSLAGGSETINGLSGSGNVISTSGTVTLTLGDNNANGNHTGAINNTTDTLSVTKIGSGTQTLASPSGVGGSNFGGSLDVNGGLVAFPSSPATAGPLGNSTVVNLNGGGISYTSSGANNLNRPIVIGASNSIVDVVNSTGVLTVAVTSAGGNLIKTGAGTTVITGSTTLNGGAAGVAVNEGTLKAGFGTVGVATISVGATGNLDQRNSAVQSLTLGNAVGALTLSAGAQVGFEIGDGIADKINVGAAGTAVTSGVVTLNFFNVGSGAGETVTAGTYTLLTAPSGLAAATYTLGTAPNGFNYTINKTDTLVSLTVSAYTPSYWRGGQNLSWNTLGSATANWTTNPGGSLDAASVPGSADTVIFSAAGAPTVTNTITTTLDAAFVIDSLQFSSVPSGITDVTITAGTGGALTLTPLSTSGGIRVLASGGNATISAPLTIGAAQTWDVDPTGSLTISGDTAFNFAVNKTNTGVVTLSGTNSGSGAFTLSAGTLNINSPTALGSGVFNIGAGTTINVSSGAIALTPNNVQNWNGDFTFTGSSDLNLGSGAVTLGSSITLTTSASALTVGGNIGDGGNNRSLTKAGAGDLVLTGVNNFGGGVTLNTGGLILGSNSALGAGTLRINGGTVAANSTVVTTNSVEANANFSIVGIGALTLGNVSLSANRIITNSNTTTTTTLSSISGAGKTLNFSGDGNTNVGVIATATGTLTKNGAGILTLSGASTYSGATTVSAGTLTVEATGSVTTASNILFTVSGATAVANIAGTYTSTGGGGLAINSGGILNTSGNVSFSGANTQALLLGTAGGSGTWNVTAGSVSVNYLSNGFGIGNGGAGTMNVSGGSVTVAGSNTFGVGFAAGGTGTLSISGTGLLTMSPGAGVFDIGRNSNATCVGTVNLDGGTLAMGRRIVKTGALASATLNFNGGLLQAGLTSTTYLTGLTRANVRDGGALIDTNGFDITVGQALLHSDNGLDNATDGGLTKNGLGVLTLSGANTFTGTTLVSGGKLQLDGTAAGVPTTSGITVGASGTLGFTAAAASTLDLTGKTMSLGGALNFDIGSEGVNDAITVQDFTLTANSAFTFNSIGGISGTYTLVSSANPITTGGFSITGQTIGRTTLTPSINTNTITVTSSLDEGRWNQAGGGNWSVGDPNMTAGNWDAYKPTVAGDAALFGSAITAPSTVVVDTPHTVGFIRFANSNAYTIGSNGSSNLTINNGANNALIAVTAGSHAIAENVALLSNMVASTAATTTLTMSGVISGAKAVIKDGDGLLELSGVNTYSGATTVSAGTLTLSGSRTATMGAINVGNLASTTGILNISIGTFTTGTMIVGSGTNALTSGIINQSGGTLTLSGNQLLLANNGTGTASGSNSTGTYNLSGGTLNTVAGSLGVLIGSNAGTTGNFNLSGTGILNMAATSTMQIARSDNAAANNSTGTFTQTGGTATVGILQMSGTATAAVNGAGGNSTLTLTGGTFAATTFNALSGGNNSASAITIGGTAQVTMPVFPTNVKGTSATATITFDSGATGFLSPAAATTTYMPAGTFTNAYLTANGAKFTVPSGRDITIAQMLEDAVSPAAVGTLTKDDVGMLTLAGANTYTGLSSVKAGTINLGNVAALGTADAGTTVDAGGRVTFGSLTTASTVAESFNIAGTGTATDGALNVGGSKTITLSGVITLSADASIKADGGAVFNLTNANAVTGTDTDLTFQTDGSAVSSITGIVSLGTGSLTKTGTSQLTLSGSNSYSGGTVLAGGTIQANHNSALGSDAVEIAGTRLSIGSGINLANAITINTNTGVAGRGLVEASAGTAVLSGPITINAATPGGGHFASVGTAILDIQGVITSSIPFAHRIGTVKFSGGGTGYATLTLGQGSMIVGANNGIATTANLTLAASGAGTLDLNGFNQSLVSITKGAQAATIGNSSTTADSVLTTTGTSIYAGLIVDSVLSGTRKVGLTVASGALTLSGANTYSGGTTVNQGTLTVDTGGTIGAATGALAVNNTNTGVGNDSILNLATALNTAVGNLSGAISPPSGGANTATINNGGVGRNFTVTQTADATYAGVIAGSGDFTLGASSTNALTLSGINTYTGATTVSAGTLLITGSIAGTASVATTGTLGGSGTIAGVTTVATTGTLSPGSNNVGTLNFSSTLTLDAGSNYAATITGAATNDKVNVTGALTANGNIVVTLSGYAPVANDTFDIADAASISGTPTFDFSNAVLSAGLSWDTSTFAIDGKIKVISADPFGPWATLNNVLGGKGGDDDGDGVSNLLEFATNSDPKSGTSGARVYAKVHTLGGDNALTYSIATRKTATFAAAGSKQQATKDNVQYTIEATNDLTTWNTVVVTELGAVDAAAVQAAIVPALPALGTDWEWHTFRTDGGSAIDPQDFIRLQVEATP